MTDGCCRIINLKELSSDYCYTKIICTIHLKPTEPDRADMGSNFFDIKNTENFFQQHIYIGKTLCNSVKFDKLNDIKLINGSKIDRFPSWNLEITVANLLDWQDCDEIVCDYCCYISCQLVSKIYNFHLGIPKFDRNFGVIQIYYGKNESNFDAEYFHGVGGRVETYANSKMLHNFSLPLKPFDMDEYYNLLDSISRSDMNSKFILLYNFLEQLLNQQLKEEKIIKNRKKKANKLCEILHKIGISEIQYADKNYQISSEILEELITARDFIAHRRKAERLFEHLYSKLLPIVISLLTKQTIIHTPTTKKK